MWSLKAKDIMCNFLAAMWGSSHRISLVPYKQILLQQKAIQAQPEKWEVQAPLEKRAQSVPRETKEARVLEELRVNNQIAF